MRIKKYRGLNDPQKKKTERNSSYSRRFRFSAILLAFLMVFQYTVVGMGVTVWAEDGSSTEVEESADADAEAKAKEAAEQKAKEEAEAKAQAEAEAQAAAEAKAADEAKAAEEKAAAEAKAAEEEVNQSKEDSTSVTDAEDPEPSREDAEAPAADNKDDKEESAKDKDKEKAEEETFPAFKDSYTASGMTVQIDAPKGALPEGVKVSVTEISPEAALEMVKASIPEGKDLSAIKAVDISFQYDGKAYTPKEDVRIVITGAELKGDNPTLFHQNKKHYA